MNNTNYDINQDCCHKQKVVPFLFVYNINTHKGSCNNETENVDECENIPFMKGRDRKTIRSGGYVADTFEAAVWAFMNTETYKDCVVSAVELGDDTDTVAAIAGGLAGVYYGIGGKKGIPQEWIDVISRKEWIEDMINKALSL